MKTRIWMYFILGIFAFYTNFSFSDEEKKSEPENSIRKVTEGLDLLNNLSSSSRLKKQKKLQQKNRKVIKRLESLEKISNQSLLVLAGVYKDTGDHENQMRILKKLIKRNPKNVKYLLELAQALRKAYFKTYDPLFKEETIKVINQALKWKDKKTQEKAQLEMLALLKYEGDSKENNYAILKLIQKLIREMGVKRSYVKDMCKYFYLNKFYKQSLSACRKGIRYDPKEASNYIYHALSMENANRIRSLLKMTARKFPNSFLVQKKVGQFFLKEEDHSLALPYFKKAVAINKNSPEAHVGLAWSLFGSKKEKQSYKHFLKACMLNKPKMLFNFKKAKSMLNQKSRFTLSNLFEKGITECFYKG